MTLRDSERRDARGTFFQHLYHTTTVPVLMLVVFNSTTFHVDSFCDKMYMIKCPIIDVD